MRKNVIKKCGAFFVDTIIKFNIDYSCNCWRSHVD